MTKGGLLLECGSNGHDPMIRMPITAGHTAVLTAILTARTGIGLQ